MVFICMLFQCSLQVGQLKSGVSTGLVRVKTIAVFVTRVQYLAETLLSIKKVVGNASNNNFNFRQSSGKRLLNLCQKFYHSCA